MFLIFYVSDINFDYKNTPIKVQCSHGYYEYFNNYSEFEQTEFVCGEFRNKEPFLDTFIKNNTIKIINGSKLN